MKIRGVAYSFVIVRHGESEFNAQNRFTGWIDCALTAKGAQEAHQAGALLRAAGWRFDRIYTSVLQRCRKSARIICDELGEPRPPIFTSWRLNERHYGALQGLNKAETAARFGEEQVRAWRRSYHIRPPALDRDDRTNPARDDRYATLTEADVPLTESLADTVRRVRPYWRNEIVPTILEGKAVLIVAHGNSIRALVKYIDALSDPEVSALNIPTGIPLVYELDKDLHPISRRYLDQAAPSSPN
jgi:2,3-bisphosphoglycerate-dependent phosphoglycerate mutase